MYSLRTCKVCQLPSVAAVRSDTTDRRPPGVLSQAGFPCSLTSRVSQKSNFFEKYRCSGLIWFWSWRVQWCHFYWNWWWFRGCAKSLKLLCFGLYLTRAPLGGGAISSPPPSGVFLRYLLNQCRYHHQTCSTLSPNNFTHGVKIFKVQGIIVWPPNDVRVTSCSADFDRK